MTLDDLPALRERVRALIDDARHLLRRDLGLPSIAAEVAEDEAEEAAERQPAGGR